MGIAGRYTSVPQSPLSALQILSEFLDAFQKQSRPVEQLVQAASLLILPMLEAGYDAGENVVDEESLTTMVNTMFDQQDGASSACTLLIPCLCKEYLYGPEAFNSIPYPLHRVLPETAKSAETLATARAPCLLNSD